VDHTVLRANYTMPAFSCTRYCSSQLGTFVQVFSGSPADGRLQRGDTFISINNHDVSRMDQKQAEEIIKAAGSALALVVKRYYERHRYFTY